MDLVNERDTILEKKWSHSSSEPKELSIQWKILVNSCTFLERVDTKKVENGSELEFYKKKNIR